MFSTMPSRSGSAFDLKAVMRFYGDALSGLDHADVIEIMRKFRLGKLGDGKWAPTPAEVRRAVEDAMSTRSRQEARDREIAEQFESRRRLKERQEGFITPETKARVQAMADEFAAAAATREKEGRSETEAQFWSRMNSPVTLSAELVQSLSTTGSTEQE